MFYVLFFECYGSHRDLHVLTRSFPTRRSSDLCGEKLDARREVGSTKVKLEKYIEQLRKSHPGIGYDAINDNSTVKALNKEHDDAEAKLKGMDKSCPVNFALASGNVGVMAATNEEVQDRKSTRLNSSH